MVTYFIKDKEYFFSTDHCQGLPEDMEECFVPVSARFATYASIREEYSDYTEIKNPNKRFQPQEDI